MLDQLALFADTPIEEALTPLPDPLPGDDEDGSPPVPFGVSGQPSSPRDLLRTLYKTAGLTDTPHLLAEIRTRLESHEPIDWDEIEAFHTQVMDAQAAVERGLPDYKHARPDDSAEILALRRAFHRFELAGFRWHQRRTDGLSDKALRAALAEELGPYGGFEGHGIVVRYKGGTTPTVWVGPETEVRILRGEALLKAAREILDLPYPGQAVPSAAASAPTSRISLVAAEEDEEDADGEVPIERAVLPPDPDDAIPELRLGPEAPKLLDDETPQLLDEVRSSRDYLDLRWWPAGNKDAPVAMFEGPTRARSVLFTLKKRHVEEEEIRAALNINWQHSGAIVLAYHYDRLATGEYANRAVDLLSAIAPAFSEPQDPASYWERHEGEAADWQQEVAALLDEADHLWATYAQLAAVLRHPVGPLPTWVVTLAKLLPFLEAFELAHPRPAIPSARKKSRGTPVEPYLVSRGAAARYALASGPEAAAASALREGLDGAHPWLIVRRIQRGELLMTVECPVAAILSVRDLTGCPDTAPEAASGPPAAPTPNAPGPVHVDAAPSPAAEASSVVATLEPPDPAPALATAAHPGPPSIRSTRARSAKWQPPDTRASPSTRRPLPVETTAGDPGSS
jgi:hypothetical protein